MINAIEAMSVVEGSRELLISTVRANSHDVLVTVQDSGPGLGAASPEPRQVSSPSAPADVADSPGLVPKHDSV